MRLKVCPVLALCSALGVAAAWLLPVVRVAPNRLVSGEPVVLASLLPVGSGLAVSLVALLLLTWLVFSVELDSSGKAAAPTGKRWLSLRATSRKPPPPSASVPGQAADDGLLPDVKETHRRAAWARLLTRLYAAAPLVGMALGVASLFWLAGNHAQWVAQTQSRLARTSLGAGFWSLLLLAWLACLDTAQRLSASAAVRSAWLAGVAAPSVALLVLGVGDQLSILKEYANRNDVFWQAIARHLQIVVTAILPSVLLGLPLAWACTRRPAWQRWLFPLLNMVQTVPSIALFGLLMAPLAWVALQFPALAQAGISGVGLAPAVLALVLYSLLPIVRSGLAGLVQVPVAAQTAAWAMGMSASQIFWRVQLPLALPVLLPGLRAAVVQTIGLTAVTALVGAGGLGSLMFDGLFSAANELVLLGVLPIVLLAMLADALFKALTALAQPRGLSEPGANTVPLSQAAGQKE